MSGKGDDRELDQSWRHDQEDSRGDFYSSPTPEPPSQEDLSIIEGQRDIINRSVPTTQLEIAQREELRRKSAQIDRLSREITKLKAFISKRKQTYKRKRKEEGAPTRALSAYNIFVQDRFSKLAKDNEDALKSADSSVQLKRVPPASLVASAGNEWRALSAEDKARYEGKARADRRRYESQMAAYQPPEKDRIKKRNKTGYNIFFSEHVRRLKASEAGVPSERGSVARLVGNAWKELSSDEKQYYEREAEKQNAMDAESIEEEEDAKRPAVDSSRFSPVAARGSGPRLDPGLQRQHAPGPPIMHQLVHGQSHRPPSHHNHAHYSPGQYQQHPQGYQYPPHQYPGHPPMGDQGHPGQSHNVHGQRSHSQHSPHMPHHHSGM